MTIKTYLVNQKGDVVAHYDLSVVQSNSNYADNPIVKAKIKSQKQEKTKQIEYKDKNGLEYIGAFRKIEYGNCSVIAFAEKKIIFAAVNRILRRNFFLMMIVLSVVILVVYYFAKSITSPIIRLVGATNKIKEGDYDINIKVASRDEIGELTSSFIEMGEGLAEREKIKTAFGKFVNPELAEMVLKNEITLGGETKKAVILFSDIRSFTAISEKMDPAEVVEFLNEYMTAMVACIEKTNGIVDKFIGDAIMAVWGVPVSKGNDIVNSVNGALMMREALKEFNKERGTEDKPLIKIGCGINAGQVLAGQIGSENRMEYTVIGDAVNLASRIEALNKPFGTDILISEDTHNQCKDIFNVKEMAPIKVKGKAKRQLIYAILGRKDDKNSPQTIEELRKLLGTKEGNIKNLEREEKYEILT
jgi:adenylate cyclase